MILNGHSSRDIMKHGREEWKVSKRQTEKYISRVQEILELTSSVNRNRSYGLAVGRLEMIYSRATANKDYKTALMTLKQLHELQGLFNQQKETDSAEGFAERMRKELKAMHDVTVGGQSVTANGA